MRDAIAIIVVAAGVVFAAIVVRVVARIINRRRSGSEIRSAIKQGDVDRVVALIGSDNSRLTMMTVFGTWLHVAASHGKLEILKRLIDMGADVNRRGGVFGGTALNDAASSGHKDVVEYLLSKGAILDISEPMGNPLFGAIYGGYTDIAKLLIERGIDTSVKYTGKSMQNMDALAFAREWGRSDIVEILTAGQGK
jgi:ankyrin repeat protein